MTGRCPTKLELEIMREEPQLFYRLRIDDPEDKFNDLITALRYTMQDWIENHE